MDHIETKTTNAERKQTQTGAEDGMGRVLIKGSGDLASGIALRLHRAGFRILMTDIAVPTTVRRTVAFSPAVYQGRMQVEDVTGVLCDSVKMAETEIQKGNIAIMVDEKAECILEFQPDVVVDAILAKRNLGTKMTDAPFVVGVGPGFTAGEDCQARSLPWTLHLEGKRHSEYRNSGPDRWLWTGAPDQGSGGRHVQGRRNNWNRCEKRRCGRPCERSSGISSD